MPPLAASIFFHAIGATAAACCYVPQKKVKGWSWQSYWLTQAAFCWLLLPIIGAFLTVPDFWQVVQAAPRGRDAAHLPAGRGLRHRRHGVRRGDPLRRFLHHLRDGHRHLDGGGHGLRHRQGRHHAGGCRRQHPGLPRQDRRELGGRSASRIGVVGVVFCGLAGRWKERDQAQAGGTAAGQPQRCSSASRSACWPACCRRSMAWR